MTAHWRLQDVQDAMSHPVFSSVSARSPVRQPSHPQRVPDQIAGPLVRDAGPALHRTGRHERVLHDLLHQEREAGASGEGSLQEFLANRYQVLGST